MPTKVASAVLTVLLQVSCAATTPAPRFSPVSPADKDGPEAASPPPAPTLAGEPEAQASAPSGDATKPAGGHEGHSMRPEAAVAPGHEGHAGPATPSPQDQVYSCPMHPEVKQASPGSCPRCGVQLVERKDAREQP